METNLDFVRIPVMENLECDPNSINTGSAPHFEQLLGFIFLLAI
jgi:hypothetical protein